MRWVLLLLVAANVMLFTWFQFRGDPQGESRESVQDLPAQRDGVATLELLSETDAAASAIEEPTAAEGGPEPTARQAPMCWMLGPMPEEVTAKQVLQRFENQAVPAELRDIEVITGLDYLLYMGPFASRAESLAKLKQLQGAGVDSFLITRGSLTEAISLGLYTRRSMAETARDSFGEQGYVAQIRENERSGTQQWVVIPMAATEKLDIPFWNELDMDFSGLERKQNWCAAIAPAESIE